MTTFDPDPDTYSRNLDEQVIARARQFLQSTEFSQRSLARAIGADPGNFSAFLAGAKSLSVNKMSKLVSVLSMNRLELEQKFAQPRLTSHILELQEGGEKVQVTGNEVLRFAGTVPSAWTPGLSGSDPDGSTDITGTNANPARACPPEDDLPEFLAGLAAIHQSAIDAINARVAKAKVQQGPSEGPRHIDDNSASQKAGPRPARFSR
jgi:hypothetical protein